MTSPVWFVRRLSPTLVALALILPVLSSRVAVPQIAARPRGPLHTDPRLRQEYWRRQRAYPNARIPIGAYQAARTYVREHWPSAWTRGGAAALGSPASLLQWQSLGPAPIEIQGAQPYAGRITTLAVDPTNGTTIYLGAADGGIWKSVNDGSSWTPLTDDQCSLSTGAMTLDPADPSIIYVGTGEANFNFDAVAGCGMLRSLDGGVTWTSVGGQSFNPPGGGPTSFNKIVVDRQTAGSATSTTVLAATTAGVFKSTNSGATWTHVLGSGATDLIADPSHPNTIYAAQTSAFEGTGNGIYRSADVGSTWTLLGGGLPTANVGRIALAIAPSQPRTLYAAIQDAFGGTGNPGQLLGVWRTDDGGSTWTKLSATGAACGGQCWYDLVMAVDPKHPDTVYFSGFFVERSIDGGKTFADISSSFMHTDQHALAISPQSSATLYAGNDGGIWESRDQGNTWGTLNTNLSITQFYRGVAANASVSGLDILGGTQDNGTDEFPNSAPWNFVLGGDGGMAAFDDRAPTTAFAEVTWADQPFGGPWRRDAGSGEQFVEKVNGINLGDRAAFIPTLVMDPVASQTLYFGSYRLYKSLDRAETWTPISGDLTRGTGDIFAIAVAPSDTKTMYIGTDDGNVQVTTDGGVTYSLVTGGLPDAAVTWITVDPSDATHAWVALSGFGSQHVFATTNRGASWQDITGDLPPAPANALVFIPSSGELDVGTDVGVFRLPAGTQRWDLYAPGLPNVAVDALTYIPAASTLLAGTHGRGLFSFATSGAAVLRGDVNGDGSVTAIDAQAILAAAVGLPLPAAYHALPNGDVTCTGQPLTALDAQIVLSFVVGSDTKAYCVGAVR